MGFKLLRIDSRLDDTTVPHEIVLPLGSHNIGRGSALLNCTDHRVSRKHAEMIVTSNQILLKSLHQNPCFFKKNTTSNTVMFSKPDTCVLTNGDQFGLTPENYWYKIVNCNEESSTEYAESRQVTQKLKEIPFKVKKEYSAKQEVCVDADYMDCCIMDDKEQINELNESLVMEGSEFQSQIRKEPSPVNEAENKSGPHQFKDMDTIIVKSEELAVQIDVSMEQPDRSVQSDVSIEQVNESMNKSNISLDHADVMQQPDVLIDQVNESMDKSNVSLDHADVMQQPDVSVDQPNASIDQLSASIVLANALIEQSNTSIDKPDELIDQPEVPVGQSDVSQDQANVSLDQPNTTIDKPDELIDQPEVPVGQSDVSQDQANVSLDQPNTTIDKPDELIDQPEVPVGQSDVSQNQANVSLDQPNTTIDKPDEFIDQLEAAIGQPDETTDQFFTGKRKHSEEISLCIIKKVKTEPESPATDNESITRTHPNQSDDDNAALGHPVKVEPESPQATNPQAGPSNVQPGASNDGNNNSPPTAQNKQLRERCMYGANCYRRNPQHKATFSHPADRDWGAGARAPCPWGAACRRADPRHLRDHHHPPAHRPPQRRPGMQFVRRNGNNFFINANAVHFYDDHFEAEDSDGDGVDYDYEF